MIKNRLIYSIAVLFLLACGSSKDTTSTTPDPSYKRDANQIHPQFSVFHVNDTASELHFKLQSKELLYTRPDGINFSSNVLITYRLLPSFDSKEIIDSASVRVVDENNEGADKDLIGKITFKAKSPRSYFLRVKVADLNRNIEVSQVIVIEKDNDLNRQNFLVKSKSSDAPIFQNHIKTGEEISIRYKSKMGVSIFVRYYNRDFPLSPPPFSMTDPKPFQYKADSLFTVQMNNDGLINFKALKKGFYHFQLDTSKRDGLTLFNYSEVFPEVKRADDLVPPLRYITSRDEYDELSRATNKKAAIEKFWLNSTGNAERAKEVIRKFYNRVQDANNFFTSYLEGWKTDRGMVYLIYGPPNTIYRTANGENWIYGEENNISSTTYFFAKVNNPFTENDYALERSTIYKQSWYIAVDTWRQGRTFSND
ncbi:MAG: GWxTD domain-containing protein [Bacteroidota bacterium]|nr:GWxTD domain-containing protein [Bacteroidota bacterium]